MCCVSLCLSPSQSCAAHPAAPALRSATGSAAGWAVGGRGRKGPDGVWVRFEGDTKLSGETSFKPQPERLSSSKPSPEEARCQTSGPLNPSAPCPGLDLRAPQAASPGPPSAGAALRSDGRLRAAPRAGNAEGRGGTRARSSPGSAPIGASRPEGSGDSRGERSAPRPRRGVSVPVEGRVKRGERRSLRRCQRRRRGPLGPRAASPLPPPRSPLSRRGGGRGHRGTLRLPPQRRVRLRAPGEGAAPGAAVRGDAGRNAGRPCGGCGCQGTRPRAQPYPELRAEPGGGCCALGKAPQPGCRTERGALAAPPVLQPPARSAPRPEGRAGRGAQVSRYF